MVPTPFSGHALLNSSNMSNNEAFKKIWGEEQGDGISKDSDELIREHYKLGHLSIPKIRLMLAMGWLDEGLSKYVITKCASCLHGKATWCPWRTKREAGQILKLHAPGNVVFGNVVFVNQLTVYTPGLIGQVILFFTHLRYCFAALILDHFMTDITLKCKYQSQEMKQ